MENAFETMNMNDIQDLYTSGVIPYLTNFKMSFELIFFPINFDNVLSKKCKLILLIIDISPMHFLHI